MISTAQGTFGVLLVPKKCPALVNIKTVVSIRQVASGGGACDVWSKHHRVFHGLHIGRCEPVRKQQRGNGGLQLERWRREWRKLQVCEPQTEVELLGGKVFLSVRRILLCATSLLAAPSLCQVLMQGRIRIAAGCTVEELPKISFDLDAKRLS